MTKIILYALILLTTACQTVIHLPATTGQYPDISKNQWGGQLGLNIGNAVPVKVIDDYTTTPPTRTTIGVGEEDILFDVLGITPFAGSFINFNLRLISRLEIYATHTYGVKFLILGKPGEKGFKTSVFGGYYLGGEKTSTESSGGSSIRQSTEVNAIEYGASIGYRKSDKWLFYLTLASRGGDADIQVDNNGVVNSYEDSFDHYLASLGVRIGDQWFISGEVTANYVDWEGINTARTANISDSGTEAGFNVGLGFAW